MQKLTKCFIGTLIFILTLSGTGFSDQASKPLEVEPTTGTSSFSFPIAVPQGRAGIQPNLTLVYSSSTRNSIFGMGWNLDFGSIELSTKNGVPKYDGTDNYVIIQNGSPQDLVYDAGVGFYRPKIESGAFMKIAKVTNGWLITDKKGSKYFFGQTNNSRQFDPANTAHIFKWTLDRVEDINGNYMTITYQTFDNQLFPQYVDYTGNVGTSEATFARISFELEDRTDPTLSYMTGFDSKITKRVKKITTSVGVNNQQSYQFNYQYSTETGRSLLTQIVQTGADGTSTLPPVNFTYQIGDRGFQQSFGWSPPSDMRFTGAPVNGRHPDMGVRVMDVNADGFPDLVRSYFDCNSNLTQNIYIHNKETNWQTSAWTAANLPAFVKSCSDFDRDRGVRFADMDADGYVDAVWSYKDINGNIKNDVYLNNHSNGWNFDGTWHIPNSIIAVQVGNDPVPDYHQFMGVLIADVNGDGLPDVIKAKEGDTHKTLLNKVKSGQGWVEDPAWEPLGDSETGIYTDFTNGATLVDLNGDGLLDIVTNSFQSIGMNTGHGWIHYSNSPWSNTFGYGNLVDGSTQFADINGDGLTDMIVAKGDYAGGSRTLINTGFGWREDPNWAVSATFQYGRAQMMDLNGDNLSDILANDATGPSYALINKGAPPDLLVKIDNGTGGITDVAYVSSKLFPATFFPFHIPVVSTVTASNSLGDSYQTSYQYAGGLWDVVSREFRGFDYVKITDPQGNYTETDYLQDDIFKGRPIDQMVFDSQGHLYGETDNQWNSQTISTGCVFPFLSRTDQYVYDGNATGKRTAQQFFYDETPQLGNLTKLVQLGEVDLTTGNDIGNDKRTVETVYNKNTTGSNWISGLPKQTTVKDNASQIVRQSWIYYDNNTLDTAPTKGLVSKKEDWNGYPVGTPTVNPTSQYTYDTYGNLLTTKDAKNNTTSISYDTAYHIFPLQTINAISHQINNEYYGVNGVALSGGGYQGLWGQIKSTTDPNNQQGKRIYDTFGRLTTTISPLDSLTYPTTLTTYTPTSTYLKILKQQRIKSGQAATIDAVEFYDGLGRLIQTKAKSETAGQYVVNGQTSYNSRGLPEKKYLPFFTTVDMNSMTAIDTSKPKATLDYDAMGRLIKTTNANGTYASVAYDDWTTSTTDENGHLQKSYFDAYGRLIKKEEYTGADGRSTNYPATSYALYATTQYTYDSEGNLTQTQDAKNNITTIAYDKLGRKTSMNDPDMHTWQYAYDLNGNLSYQIDAKNKRIDFTYDALNRLTNKTDSASLNVTYTYDDAAVSNSKGRLTQAQYGSSGAKTQFTYDPLGREIASTKTVDTTAYPVNRIYDDLDRLQSLKYPDQFGIVYTYNDAGQIETVKEGVAQ